LMGTPIGRFELGSGRNYNRGYPMLHDQIAAAVANTLTSDIDVNKRLIQAAWREALLARTPQDGFEALQRQLMLFAHDADIVLDLHCSREAAMHLYTCETVWKQVESLACYIGAKASLLGLDSGGGSFDEMQTYTWYRLKETFGKDFPIPHGAVAVTVEHRGQRDVTDDIARQDATAIVNYLIHEGFIQGEAETMPALPYPATPLSGAEQFRAPVAGILIHRANVGDWIEPGQPLFDVVDPVGGERTTVHSQTAGVLFMRRDVRLVRYGDPLGRVSGDTPLRTGNLLSA
jgi:predicted deacylase